MGLDPPGTLMQLDNAINRARVAPHGRDRLPALNLPDGEFAVLPP